MTPPDLGRVYQLVEWLEDQLYCGETIMLGVGMKADDGMIDLYIVKDSFDGLIDLTGPSSSLLGRGDDLVAALEAAKVALELRTTAEHVSK